MNLNNLDLNKVAVFSRVVESGNYRIASESLHVTASALSQTITQLEHNLGIALFNRIGRNLVPTLAGLELHRQFQKHHGAFIESLRRLDPQKKEFSGLLRIGSYLEFAKSQLTPLIHEFSRRFPEARVKISFDRPSALHQQLERGKLDLCFSIYPSLERRKIESVAVYAEELVLIAPKGMLSNKPSLTEILRAPLIEYYANHQPLRRWMALHFAKRPRELGIRVYASTAEMVLALVGAGTGIGIVPRFILDTEPRKNNIDIIRPTAKKLADNIWLLENKSPRSRLHQEFHNITVEKLTLR